MTTRVKILRIDVDTYVVYPGQLDAFTAKSVSTSDEEVVRDLKNRFHRVGWRWPAKIGDVSGPGADEQDVFQQEN